MGVRSDGHLSIRSGCVEVSKAVKIACKGADAVPVDSLVHFQGDLKSLSKENYDKLKAEILVLGFSEPVSVWSHEGQLFLLNGHQRTRVLKQMGEEGFVIPPIPVNYVDASDIKEAKKKVLSLTSQYGQMEREGLYQFMTEADLTLPELDNFRFPEIDLEDFEKEFFEDVNFTAGTEEDQGQLDQKKLVIMECPYCEKHFEQKQARIIEN